MLGSYLGFTLLVSTSIGELGVGWGLIIIVLMVAGAMALLGILIERVAYAPLRKSGRLAPVVSALGVSIFLQNAAMLIWGSRYRATPSGRLWTAAGNGGVHITLMRDHLGVSIILMLLLYCMIADNPRRGHQSYGYRSRDGAPDGD